MLAYLMYFIVPLFNFPTWSPILCCILSLHRIAYISIETNGFFVFQSINFQISNPLSFFQIILPRLSKIVLSLVIVKDSSFF